METINHECYVSLEVAKLLKQAGFDWKCEYAYMPDTEMGNVPFKHLHNRTNYNELQYEVYSAPTLGVAQQWLREVKNCYAGVEVFVHNLDVDNIYYTYNWVVYFNSDKYSGSDFDTIRYYEVAQEASIRKALEIILEK